jgi:peroxiredoxin Q/BCP
MNRLLFFFILLFVPLTASAQNTAETSCGINSAMSLARVLGLTSKTRDALQAEYPNASVSLLNVKQMCQRLDLKTSGVKATLAELLQSGAPCIIGLKEPDHFTVLLDGTNDELRILEGEDSALQIVPRREIESRFTGYALLPDISTTGAPKLQMPQFDQYRTFEGMGQKVEYRFPVSNTGQAPLALEIAGTSCGCTAALLEGGDQHKTVLQPRQSKTVVVSYQVETRAPIQQSVTLRTNDPRHREVYLSIRGQLPPQLTLSPPALYVEQNQGEEPGKVFKLIGPTGTGVEKIWSDLSYLRFTIGAQSKEGERVFWPVAVNGFAQAPAGLLRGKVFVKLKGGQEMFLPVRGEIESTAPGAAQAALLPRAEDDPLNIIAVATPTIKVGQAAPDFTATGMDGKVWRLSDLEGKKNLLLTFFPKCFTGGCANHLSSLRDHQAEFDAADTQILAVSVDPAEGEKGQRAFAAQWKFSFPLIPDTKRELTRLYGATQDNKQLAARMSVIIDKNGIVRWIDTDVHVSTHGADMLAKMRELGMAK